MSLLSLMLIRRRLTALFVLCFCFPVVAVAQLSRPENVMVDGTLSEWANPLPNYDKVTKFYYDIHNDKDFLYIALKRLEWGEKVRATGRILVEVGAGLSDSSALKIIYPAANTYDVIDMWNFLAVSTRGSRTMDTVTIYNDYGIQAGGGFRTYDPPVEKTRKVLSPLGEPDAPIATILGADCELAIPLTLLPAAAGNYTIRVILRGESGTPRATEMLAFFSGMRIQGDAAAPMKDLYIATTLTIPYHLK